MKLSNYSSSKDNPVIPNLSITPAKFKLMSADAQRQIVNSNAMKGSQGSENPTWDVPPYCVRGVSLGEMIEAKELLNEDIQNAGKRKANKLSRDKRIKEQIDQYHKRDMTN